MIQLSKLDHSKILVNPEAIKYIETVPDTLILFLNGDTLLVEESLETIGALWRQLKADLASMASNSNGLRSDSIAKPLEPEQTTPLISG